VSAYVGESDGVGAGLSVGSPVGCSDGAKVGRLLGAKVGVKLGRGFGYGVGLTVLVGGLSLGAGVYMELGGRVGCFVGLVVLLVGKVVGPSVDSGVGKNVGTSVRKRSHVPQVTRHAPKASFSQNVGNCTTLNSHLASAIWLRQNSVGAFAGVGDDDGAREFREGLVVGCAMGSIVGACVGELTGVGVELSVGSPVGKAVGLSVDSGVGKHVGTSARKRSHVPQVMRHAPKASFSQNVGNCTTLNSHVASEIWLRQNSVGAVVGGNCVRYADVALCCTNKPRPSLFAAQVRL
jgi:hypothetical protein